MAFLKPTELTKFDGIIQDGTKENPKIHKLNDLYKVAVYLGFKLKWDYDWDYREKERIHRMEPMFKKSYAKFIFASYGHLRLEFFYETVLPEMEKRGHYTQEIKDKLIALNEQEFLKACIDKINEVTPDIKLPFEPKSIAYGSDYNYVCLFKSSRYGNE